MLLSGAGLGCESPSLLKRWGRFATMGGMDNQPKIDAADIINRLSAELSAMTTRAVLAESRVAELESEQAKDGAES